MLLACLLAAVALEEDQALKLAGVDGTAEVHAIDDDTAVVLVKPKSADAHQGRADYGLYGFARLSGKWVLRGGEPSVCSYEWNNGGEGESLECSVDLTSFNVPGETLIAVTETTGSHYGDSEDDTTTLQIFRFLDGELVRVLNESAKGERHTDTYFSDFDESLDTKMSGKKLVVTRERKVLRRGKGDGKKSGKETIRYVWDGATFAGSAAVFVNTTATASSELSAKYAVKNVVDGDPRTFWAEGAKGPGVGESITLKSATPATFTALRVRAGNAKSLALFLANHRPKKLRVTIGAAEPVIVTLADHRFVQDVSVKGTGDTVRIEIVDVYRGDKDDDTCVTELALRT